MEPGGSSFVFVFYQSIVSAGIWRMSRTWNAWMPMARNMGIYWLSRIRADWLIGIDKCVAAAAADDTAVSCSLKML